MNNRLIESIHFKDCGYLSSGWASVRIIVIWNSGSVFDVEVTLTSWHFYLVSQDAEGFWKLWVNAVYGPCWVRGRDVFRGNIIA